MDIRFIYGEVRLAVGGERIRSGSSWTTPRKSKSKFKIGTYAGLAQAGGSDENCPGLILQPAAIGTQARARKTSQAAQEESPWNEAVAAWQQYQFVWRLMQLIPVARCLAGVLSGNEGNIMRIFMAFAITM